MVPGRNTIKPLKPDYRDLKFVHSKKFGTVALTVLPPTGFGRVPYKINQQYTTNFCTAAGTESAAEYEQKRPFSFEFQVAAVSRMAGEPIIAGANPRDAYKARCAYGCLPDELTPRELRLVEAGADKVADWKNWPSYLWDDARAFVAESFFWLGEEYAPFDQVREALWSARDENQVVMASGRWYESWNNVGPDGILPPGTGSYTLHEYIFIDWTQINGKDYLVIQNSVGTTYGKGGLQYIDRDTMNSAWPRAYGDGTALAIWRKLDPKDINSLRRQWLSLAEILSAILDAVAFKIKQGGI
jgi:hypothetical protein